MTQVSRPVLAFVAFGLAGLATSASSDAFASRGFGGGRAPHISGGGIGRMPSAARLRVASRPSPVRAIPVFVPPPRGPRQPPFTVLPHPPIIGHFPHPVWPPIVINHYPHHHWPIIPVGGPIVVPTAVAVGTVGAVGIATRVEAAPVSVGGTCAVSGSFVSVVFLPTATVADVTAFLKAYNVTMADGPSVDGIYRIRLSDVPLPENRIVEIVTSMRSQAAIVSTVNG